MHAAVRTDLLRRIDVVIDRIDAALSDNDSALEQVRVRCGDAFDSGTPGHRVCNVRCMSETQAQHKPEFFEFIGDVSASRGHRDPLWVLRTPVRAGIRFVVPHGARGEVELALIHIGRNGFDATLNAGQYTTVVEAVEPDPWAKRTRAIVCAALNWPPRRFSGPRQGRAPRRN